MNRVLKKPVFRCLLVLSLITSPVLAIADTISEAAAQNQPAAVEMPCHQMKHIASDSEESGMHTTSAPCSCCDQCSCFQIKTCHQCPGWGHLPALLTRPSEFAAVGMRKIIDPAGERILDFNLPPLLPPPLPLYTS